MVPSKSLMHYLTAQNHYILEFVPHNEQIGDDYY
ncbi:Uncharacterised protein [Acinetobacter baumannii]|nr:Uncharacterised protein [Acinetobacter baumannii]